VQYLFGLLTKNSNSFISEATKDPRVVAEVLIQYFTSAASPIIPFEYYDSFMIAQTIIELNEKLRFLEWQFSFLEEKIKRLIHILLQFLHDLCKKKSSNNADINQLSLTFAPILLRPIELEYYMVNDSTDVVMLTKLMIENVDPLF